MPASSIQKKVRLHYQKYGNYWFNHSEQFPGWEVAGINEFIYILLVKSKESHFSEQHWHLWSVIHLAGVRQTDVPRGSPKNQSFNIKRTDFHWDGHRLGPARVYRTAEGNCTFLSNLPQVQSVFLCGNIILPFILSYFVPRTNYACLELTSI